MATRRFDTHKMKKSFWLGFKFNLFMGILLMILSALSVILADLLYIESHSNIKKLGTVGDLKYNYPDQFDFYVIENHQRNFEYDKAHQLIKKYPNIPIYSHRLRLSDWDDFSYNLYFFLDDWWLENCRFWYKDEWDYPLRQTLKLMPKNTEVVINEHKFNSINRLIEYVSILQKDYPDLKFSVGIQIHLQWIDLALFKKLYIINQIDKSGLNWMISEYSMIDKIYKNKLILGIDRFIPLHIRRSFSAHQSYIVSRQCGKSDHCQGMTIWVPNGTWMIKKLSKGFDGKFWYWHENNEPTIINLAIKKGLSK